MKDDQLKIEEIESSHTLGRMCRYYSPVRYTIVSRSRRICWHKDQGFVDLGESSASRAKVWEVRPVENGNSTEVLMYTHLRPKPKTWTWPAGKRSHEHPGQVRSQVRGRSLRSQVRGSPRPGPKTWDLKVYFWHVNEATQIPDIFKLNQRHVSTFPGYP